MSGSIVVGVDGSEPSIDALRWAAGQAKLTGDSLLVVAAWHYPPSLGWTPAWPPDWDPAAEAASALNEVVERELGSAELEVRQQVVEGIPPPSWCSSQRMPTCSLSEAGATESSQGCSSDR